MDIDLRFEKVARAPTESLREKEAREKSLWLSGKSDIHPHGESGKRQILPFYLTGDCWDTAKDASEFSEWGNAAGFGGGA